MCGAHLSGQVAAAAGHQLEAGHQVPQRGAHCLPCTRGERQAECQKANYFSWHLVVDVKGQLKAHRFKAQKPAADCGGGSKVYVAHGRKRDSSIGFEDMSFESIK